MIYTTFKQWVKGRFLETGEPRKKAYSKDELLLIEMGWNYGYDAGVEWGKSQQALDKRADNARELGLDYEPENTLHWHALNYRTAPTQNAQAMFEALEKFVASQHKEPEHEPVALVYDPTTGSITPLQRTWVNATTWRGLTDEEIKLQWSEFWETDCHAWSIEFARAIEIKLKEKNT